MPDTVMVSVVAPSPAAGSGAQLSSRLNRDATKDKTSIHNCPEGAISSGRSPGRGIDSYTLKSENLSFSNIYMSTPHPLPLETVS